jgi:signal transduction histidine kinase
MFKTLRGRVIFTYFIVVIISLLLSSVFFLFFLSRYIRNRDRSELRGQIGAIAQDVRQVGGNPAPANSSRQGQQPVVGVARMLNSDAEVLKAKLALVFPDGTVAGESRGAPVLGRRIVQLPAGILNERGPLVTQRYFKSLKKDYLFATAPTQLGGKKAFLMALKPVEKIRAVVTPLIGYVALAGGIALALSMLLALYLSGAISRPIREVTKAARKMAAGDYSAEVAVHGSDETAELARDFNMMAQRVRAAYELQKDFVADVSHELRTPLTSIEGFSQALLDGVTTSEQERRRSLEIINQESKRLVRLLRDLLLLSRIDAGEMKPEVRQTDLVDLMRKLDSVYSPGATEAGLELEVSPPAHALSLLTDPDRLERVLTNLLDNAIKYCEPGARVTLSAEVEVASVCISVTDTGPGIAPELLPNIFDRFYRVEKSRSLKHGGSGLGLSICKELVWSLGGTIKVQSVPGKGTAFSVTLPIS